MAHSCHSYRVHICQAVAAKLLKGKETNADTPSIYSSANRGTTSNGVAHFQETVSPFFFSLLGILGIVFNFFQLDSMSPYLWMHVGCLSLVLVAVGTMECTEQESLIRQISIAETTQCLIDCTVQTFSKIVELGDKRNIRMKDSSQEEQRSKNGIFY